MDMAVSLPEQGFHSGNILYPPYPRAILKSEMACGNWTAGERVG